MTAVGCAKYAHIAIEAVALVVVVEARPREQHDRVDKKRFVKSSFLLRQQHHSAHTNKLGVNERYHGTSRAEKANNKNRPLLEVEGCCYSGADA